MSDALIVFAKVPEPGQVKTRLTPMLSPGEAARLYEAFLRDALSQYSGLGAAVRLYLAPPERSLPGDLVPSGVDVCWQAGEGLGARMQRAFVETFAAGAHRAVVIGTDHPTLPSSFIEQAFLALDAPRSVAIGPSNDGGYYLLGMNDVLPPLFEMTYSHEAVFDETLTRAAAAGADLTILPPWYDVDTPDDLRRLVEELDASSVEAPHTRAALADLRPFIEERTSTR
jgi:rSAM/selenodomain-associated transferase 1